MNNITHYFSWDLRPAILVNRGSFYNGYYLQDTSDKEWNEAPIESVLDMFVEGVEMDVKEFEKEFGVLGEDIPDVPS